jgi:hypothetical protein
MFRELMRVSVVYPCLILETQITVRLSDTSYTLLNLKLVCPSPWDELKLILMAYLISH